MEIIVSENVLLEIHGTEESRDESTQVFLKNAHLIDGFERDAW